MKLLRALLLSATAFFGVAHAQTTTTLPVVVPAATVVDLGAGPLNVRVLQGNPQFFTGSGSSACPGTVTSQTLINSSPGAGGFPFWTTSHICVTVGAGPSAQVQPSLLAIGAGSATTTTLPATIAAATIVDLGPGPMNVRTLSGNPTLFTGSSSACPGSITTQPLALASPGFDLSFWTTDHICANVAVGPTAQVLPYLLAIGSGGGTPGGTPGQVQYNNAGAFGGFTVSGDGTLNTATGALTVTKSNGSAFGTAAFANTGTSGGTLGLLNTANTYSATQAFAGVTASTLAVAGCSIPGSVVCATGNISSTTGFGGPALFGGVAAGSSLTVESTVSGSPSGDVLSLFGSHVIIGNGTNNPTTIDLNGALGGGVTVNIANAGNGLNALNVYNAAGSKQTWVPGGGATTITFPTATDTLVGKATTDTLTNKTLTFPFLTNPLVTGTSPNTDGQLGYNSPLLNWYDGTTIRNIVGDTSTQTLTNKTINGASNTLTVRLASDISGFGTGVATGAGTAVGTAGGFPTIIGKGTLALGTSLIASQTCGTAATASVSGVATTDVIDIGYNGDPTATTGYTAAAPLAIVAYPTANTVNIKQCNYTSASITPAALTVNYSARR